MALLKMSRLAFSFAEMSDNADVVDIIFIRQRAKCERMNIYAMCRHLVAKLIDVTAASGAGST